MGAEKEDEVGVRLSYGLANLDPLNVLISCCLNHPRNQVDLSSGEATSFRGNHSMDFHDGKTRRRDDMLRIHLHSHIHDTPKPIIQKCGARIPRNRDKRKMRLKLW